MKTKTYFEYESPELWVIDVLAERGFAATGGDDEEDNGEGWDVDNYDDM